MRGVYVRISITREAPISSPLPILPQLWHSGAHRQRRGYTPDTGPFLPNPPVDHRSNQPPETHLVKVRWIHILLCWQLVKVTFVRQLHSQLNASTHWSQGGLIHVEHVKYSSQNGNLFEDILELLSGAGWVQC